MRLASRIAAPPQNEMYPRRAQSAIVLTVIDAAVRYLISFHLLRNRVGYVGMKSYGR